MNSSSSFLKRIRSVLVMIKNGFWFVKKSDMFCNNKKSGFLERKFRSILVIKFFWFDLLKIPDLFCNNKKVAFGEKIQICVYYIKQSLLIWKSIRSIFGN